jgi:hypothetical protein
LDYPALDRRFSAWISVGVVAVGVVAIGVVAVGVAVIVVVAVGVAVVIVVTIGAAVVIVTVVIVTIGAIVVVGIDPSGPVAGVLQVSVARDPEQGKCCRECAVTSESFHL